MLWGAPVIVPACGCPEVLQQLHQSHLGIAKMKGLARSYVWWPKLVADVELWIVNNCMTCQQHRQLPAAAPLHPWEWPDKPWQRLHVDYAGPFQAQMFFLIIDAHSK